MGHIFLKDAGEKFICEDGLTNVDLHKNHIFADI